MKKLFIIGNGFDAAHRLKTTYEDFRKFLCEEYSLGDDIYNMWEVPQGQMGPKGELIIDECDVAAFLVSLISQAEPDGECWSELEASLGKLDYSELFDSLPEVLDEDGDEDYFKTAYNNEDMASDLFQVVPYIQTFFTEWINTVRISDVEPKQAFRSLIGESDIFLTFNYTKTLEDCYQVPSGNICHIHGKQGGKLLFGHGRKDDDGDYSDGNAQRFWEHYIGSEYGLTELDYALRKDTAGALKQNQSFFDNVGQDTQAVYTAGFSFGDVDLVYIKEICKRLPQGAVWYLNNYDKSRLGEYQKKIKQCGFMGTFQEFGL